MQNNQCSCLIKHLTWTQHWQQRNKHRRDEEVLAKTTCFKVGHRVVCSCVCVCLCVDRGWLQLTSSLVLNHWYCTGDLPTAWQLRRRLWPDIRATDWGWMRICKAVHLQYFHFEFTLCLILLHWFQISYILIAWVGRFCKKLTSNVTHQNHNS